MTPLKSINRGYFATVAAATFLAVAGIVASWHTADQIREAEHAAWLAAARAETVRLTDHLIANLYKTEVNLRAISERFRANGGGSRDTFGALIEEAKRWDPDVRFITVAFAERMSREQRAAYEQTLGESLKTVGTPRTPAPVGEESYSVRLVAPPNELLRPNMDLATHPAFLATIKTAERLPGTAVLGPSFVGVDDKREIPIAIVSNLPSASGVMVATLALAPFFDVVKAYRSSTGLDLRVVEHDSEAGTSAIRVAVVGDMTPPPGVTTLVVRLSRDLARWALHWDVSDSYRGGPDKAIEKVIRFGGSSLSVILSAVLAFLVIQSLRFQGQVQERTAELTRSAMIIQLTMDSIDQGFAVWNSDHRLVVWSRRCLDFWYHPDGWIRPGIHLRDLLVHLARHGAFGIGDPEPLAEAELNRIVVAGTNSQEHFTMLDGRHVLVRRFPLEHGGHVAVYTDTSSQDQAMDDLSRARDTMEETVRQRTKDLIIARDKAEQASNAKTRLLANVSHELRTPLNAIIGFADMIRTGLGGAAGEGKTSEYAGHIKRAGEDLLKVVSDLLEVSRAEAGGTDLDIRDIDVGAAVQDVFGLVTQAARSPALVLVGDIPEDLPPLRADPVRFRQILLNLVDNAAKFSNLKGKVEVSARIDRLGAMMIRIKDNGIGIAARDLPRVLEPFAQVQDIMSRAHGGIGLGLPLAKSLTEIMNGRLTIESAPGVGTTVTLTFPRSQIG